MAKKTRMGRNLNALLGGATRTRPEDTRESGKGADSEESVVADKPDAQTVNNTAVPSSSATISTASSTLTSGQFSTVPAKDANSPSAAVVSSAASTAAPKSVAAAESTSSHSPSAATSPSEPSRLSTAEPNVTATQNNQAVTIQADSHPTDRLRMLGVDQITRGTYQPRRHFDQVLLQELADSITAQGLIQPILVRAYGGKFELIAGERRWRASQLAGITDIPAIVRDMDDQSVAAVSLIENIQRADLNPLEEAQALERLCGEFSMTHQQVAEAVGRSRVAVTNLMRLLELHDDVKAMVDKGELDMGHARALLGAPRNDQLGIAKRITQQGLTVRAVEKLVKDLREGKSSSSEATRTDPNIEALRQKLGKLLGAPVSIKHQQSGSGKLEISYSSVGELEGILSHIK